MKKYINLRILGGVLFVFYMFVIAGKTAYKNYQMEAKIGNLKKEIEIMEEENQDLKNSIIYYQSENFKEREARLKFGLQKPGETVIVVPSAQPFSEKEEKEEEKKSNFLKWKEFLFGG